MPPLSASLYVHVPFCAGACDYCDFYSVPVLSPADSRPERFVKKLLLDAERLLDDCRPACLPTLYIGGGTPSILGDDGIRKLLHGLSGLIGRYAPPPKEITVEANPESADEAFLAAAREAGATRLSLGVQSFHGPSRQAVRRVGASSGETFLRRRLALASAYFPAAFSGDLMSGLPFQTEQVLRDDIAALLACKPAHVSFYALTVEPETALAAAEFLLPEPDEADRLWLCGREILEQSGYGQYEVSNFCLDGCESRHNIRYWRMQNWLALGPAASGTIIDDEAGTGFRFTIPEDLDAWLAANGKDSPQKSCSSQEVIDTLALIKETFLMGFRYIGGPNEELFRRRFRRSIGDLIPKTLGAWQGRGLLQRDRTALTKEGLLFLDPFLLDAFRELDASWLSC